jgi:cob(I)alamin adenosyltransferase
MKVYTQTGDGGKTSLLSGERVAKCDARIQAYGEIDELNSVVGALIAALAPDTDSARHELEQIQSELFHAGAWLAATPGAEVRGHLSAITVEHTRRIERWIDAMDEQLPELKRFVLPGGGGAAAWAHIARTVCRRAERGILLLVEAERRSGAEDGGIDAVVAYVNRLSDYFFVLARWLNHRSGRGDAVWQE